MAIALDGGVPDYGADRPGSQPRLGIFKRRELLDAERPGPAGVAGGPGKAPLASPLADLAVRPLAVTESFSPSQYETPAAQPAPDFNAALVKESFTHMMANAALAMEHFYSHLFTVSPETRAMFPMGMSQMRERVFAALARLVWSMDRPEEFTAYLAQLGRDHRKYGVKDQHYHTFLRTLLDTVAYFGASDWTVETAAAWESALAYAARMMRSAAEADARDHPPWWVGEIIAHDRRSVSVAVLTIRPDKPLPYRPGQYVPVQVTKWPRVWRPYSIANAPRADSLIELHVRAVPGGLVSSVLVRDVVVGDIVLLGPAAGPLAEPDSDRDLLCLAGGTGLAPLKAIIEQVVGHRRVGVHRKITLFAGARSAADLYDLPALQTMQAVYPGLEVIPVLAAGPGGQEPAPSGLTGLLPDVVHGHGGHGLFDNSEAYVCGPAAMVRQAALMLSAQLPPGQIHHDPLPAEQSLLAARPVTADPDDFRQSPLLAKFGRPGILPDAPA